MSDPIATLFNMLVTQAAFPEISKKPEIPETSKKVDGRADDLTYFDIIKGYRMSSMNYFAWINSGILRNWQSDRSCWSIQK